MGQILALLFNDCNWLVASSQVLHSKLQGSKATYFIIEITNLKNVLNICYSICHTQVSLGITQQYDITVVFQLFKILSILQGTIMFVVNMNQFSFKSF